MRRLILLMVGCAVSLSACGPAGSSGKVVLHVASWGGAGDDSDYARTHREVLREFERQNPGIEVRMEYIPGSQDYVRKMLLNFIAHAEPDIMTLDASSAAVFIKNGVLRDLAPLASSDPLFDWGAYFDNVVDIARRDQEVFAVPIDFTPMVMYYNKRKFDAAGMPYPKPGWTFDDFVAKAKRLTQGDQYGFTFSNWMPGWIMWLWNNGGDVLSPDGTRASGTLDSEANIKTISFIRDLINVYKVSPSLSESAAMGVDLFQDGRAAMQISGHWAMVGFSAAPKDANGIAKLKLEDVGVAPLPTNIGKSVTVMYETGLSIGKNCKHPQEAWRFIRYYTSREVQEKLIKAGIAVCARKDVASSMLSDPRERAFFDIVPSARAPWGAKVEAYEFVERAGTNMMDSVLKSGKSPADALRDTANDIDRNFAKQ